jgi:DNA polymerase-3 subunit epsilon
VTAPRIGLSVPAEQIAAVLDSHVDFRVQRRLEPMQRRDPKGRHADGDVGLALAIETSGRDHRRHQIIELSLQRFRIDDGHRIVETGDRRTWLEEAAIPIQQSASGRTDLVDGDLIGRAISDAEATGILLDVDFVVTHDARATRPFVEARLPMAAGRPWVCSLSDLDWRREGFDGTRLAELIAPMGWFYEAHRAEADVSALLHMLDHRLGDGATVIGRLLDHATHPNWMVEVSEARPSARDVLEARGYRWDEYRGLWSVVLPEDAVACEIAWAKLMLYGGRREPGARRITWRERYA